MKQRLTQEYLKECLTYDSETGIFTWNTRPLSHFKTKRSCSIINSRWANKEAGSSSLHGYISVPINNKKYYCHRLAFLYIDGYMPENFIDHIDRDPSNNRWSNLREVSTQCNLQNCDIQKNNTSGVCGVTWDKKRNKWKSQIMTSRRGICLGRFDNFDDAVMARYQEEVTNPLWTCSVESTAYKYLKERNLI